jgi:hypothetical protein
MEADLPVGASPLPEAWGTAWRSRTEGPLIHLIRINPIQAQPQYAPEHVELPFACRKEQSPDKQKLVKYATKYPGTVRNALTNSLAFEHFPA